LDFEILLLYRDDYYRQLLLTKIAKFLNVNMIEIHVFLKDTMMIIKKLSQKYEDNMPNNFLTQKELLNKLKAISSYACSAIVYNA